MRVVCWHPVLTDHQSYTWEALQRAGVESLAVCVLDQQYADRQAQGWVNRHATSVACQHIPARGWFRFCLQRLQTDKQAIHIFGSPFERPRLMLVLLAALYLGRRVLLISEPYSPIAAGYQGDGRRLSGKIKAALRPLVYRMYGALLRRRLAGVLAISPLSARQYAEIGIAPERIFPFGYFVARQPLSELEHGADSAPVLRLVFIGTLIARKGLDVLMAAVERARAAGVAVELDIYGPGDASRLAVDGSGSHYCGMIPFGEAQQVISHYDFLVLPSRYDGWGVVVNEALQAGVPVICSDAAGAAAIIGKWQCGAVFRSADVDALTAVITALPTGPALVDMKGAARRAGDALDPLVAGQYLYEVLGHVQSGVPPQRPECPWYEI